MKDVAWFLTDAYNKMREERVKLSKYLLKKESALDDLENSQPI